jgi:hypothetical protein
VVGLASSLSRPTPSYAPPQTHSRARAAGAHTRAVSSEFEFKFKPYYYWDSNFLVNFLRAKLAESRVWPSEFLRAIYDCRGGEQIENGREEQPVGKLPLEARITLRFSFLRSLCFDCIR